MKKITLIILTFMISTLCMTSCSAAEPSTNSGSGFVLTMQIGESVMTVNGVKKEIDPGRGTTPVIINERTLVPIRALIEEIGGAIAWEEDTQNVIIALGKDIIILTIDSTTAFVNEEAKTLDTAPTTINDRTMLPIRFISENLGYKVDWNENEQLITITK